jgi:hypothetical protein
MKKTKTALPKNQQLKLFTDSDIGFKPLEVLSYGGGKQTFAMLVLIEQGKLPKPNIIIFADTRNESPETYWHIENVAMPLMARLAIPFVKVSKGDLYEYCWQHEITPIWPTCTTSFKIQPINNYLREAYNLKSGRHQVNTWIGITTDESHRMTPSQVQYIEKVYPLINLEMNRQDCIEITKVAGYPVAPKSGCMECCHKDWERQYWQQPDRFEWALNLERHAQTRRPSVKRSASLPEYGRSLRKIHLLPNPKYNQLVDAAIEAVIEDACSIGYCGV